MKTKVYPNWDDVLSAASRLQEIIKGTVLVGRTAAAVFAKHRISTDADHIMTNLRSHFDAVLQDIEDVAGWKTARVNRPVLILRSLDGVETGIRQLIRSEPLETKIVVVNGQKISLPTEEEILRIKGALILKRNATRDFLDFAALSDFLGREKSVLALQRFDELYPQKNGNSPLQQLALQLASPNPFDLNRDEFKQYKNLSEKWQNWENVKRQCQDISLSIMDDMQEKAPALS